MADHISFFTWIAHVVSMVANEIEQKKLSNNQTDTIVNIGMNLWIRNTIAGAMLIIYIGTSGYYCTLYFWKCSFVRSIRRAILDILLYWTVSLKLIVLNRTLAKFSLVSLNISIDHVQGGKSETSGVRYFTVLHSYCTCTSIRFLWNRQIHRFSFSLFSKMK